MIWDAEDLEWTITTRMIVAWVLFVALGFQVVGAMGDYWFGAGYLRC